MEIEGLESFEILQPETQVSFDQVEVETWEDGLRPDLIGTLVRKQGHGGTRHRLIIEVRVTHAVDARKLAILRTRDESVLEIDLSRVDRDLAHQELEEWILQKAPRSWLFHRRIERRRVEIARERADREKQRLERQARAVAAEAQAEKVREAARAWPARPSTAGEVVWIERQLRNWTLIERAKMLSVAAQDDIFAVEPRLWRLRVISVLAPWEGETLKLTFRPELRKISETLGQELKEQGWVKPPFGRKLTRWTGIRKEPWDPVADAVESFLKNALAAVPSGALFSNSSDEMARVARDAREAWRAHLEFAREVLRSAEELRLLGGHLLIRGREPSSEEDVSILLAEGAAQHPPDPGHWYFKEILREALKGRSGPKPNSPVAEFEALGFELSLTGDQSQGRTTRALEAFQEQHCARWQAELGASILTEAESFCAVFQRLGARAPELMALFEREGFAFLLDARAASACIAHPLDPKARMPMETALKAVQDRAVVYRSLAADLNQVLSIAETATDVRLAAFLRQEGLAIGLRHAAARERRHLKGLRREQDRTGVCAVITELEQLAQRWGYGEDFPRRALDSRPPGLKVRLLDLLFGGVVVEYRKAVADIRGRRTPPGWVQRS